MTLSYKIHAATATTGDVSGEPLGYSFDFPSLSEDDITVTVAGSPKSKPAEYTIVNWTADAGQNPYIKFASQTARGTGVIRISRGTTSSGPEHEFQVGSAIKAADLNTCNKQNIYLAQENRDSLNALALGDASSAIQINSANIANLTIQAEDIKSDAVETDKIDDFAVTEGKLAPNAVTNIKVATNAAIQGTKISPDFGSQNIVTTGVLSSDNITITGPIPQLNLTDSGQNPDYSIKNHDGIFAITDNTNSAIKFKIDHTDGHVDLPSHVDIGGGADVTGNLSVSGNVTLSSGNADNKGLIFPTDIGGGTGDKAYIRYYVDGTGENTRLHIGNENDADDDIYLDSGLVHTSGNFTVNGTCTATSFVGNFPTPALEIARLSSNLTIPNNSWQTKLTLNITPSTSGTKLFVTMNGAATSAQDQDGSVKQIQVRLSRGSTILVTYATTSNASSTDLNLSFPYKDSYSHNGNQVTYTIQARYTGGGDDNPTLRSGTNIVVQEIL